MATRKFERILVANRSEIAIRVFRACTELGIRTLGIFSKEDRSALHRYKADETYPLDESLDPIKAYLDIPGIIGIAKRHRRRRHPPRLRLPLRERRLRPGLRGRRHRLHRPAPAPARPDGRQDRRPPRGPGRRACPVVPGTDEPLADADAALRPGPRHRLPRHPQGLLRRRRPRHARLPQRRRAARVLRARPSARPTAAFGRGEIFLEKYLESPKHIEVQILADAHGNTVHLYERDCSVQRRHQKVVEIAPSPDLDPQLRATLCDAGRAPVPRRRLRQRRHRRVPGRRAAAATTSSR